MANNQTMEQADNRFPNMPQNTAIPTDNVNQATTAIEAQRAVAEAQGKLEIPAKRVRRIQTRNGSLPASEAR